METALLKVVNDIFHNMNRRHVTLLVLLDLSTAFDTIDHKILLHRLQISFGITDSVLMWFNSYLLDCSQHVMYVLIAPNYLMEYCRGPFYPLLFTICVSKRLEVVKTCLPIVHGYADDSQLYLSFQPDRSYNMIRVLYEAVRA